MELLNMFFTVVHRPGSMLEDANYLSRLGEDVHVDPLMKHYLEFARQIYTKNTHPRGEVHFLEEKVPIEHSMAMEIP
eukprot:9408940-Ditylum_brightwellii.AAC.1